MIRIARASLLTVFALSSAAVAAAQVGGSLSGVVKDPSGGVMPGVNVTATNTMLGTMFNTTTDGQGLYSFPKLPVAKYEVTMQIDGFKPQKRTGIQVDADSALQINVTLELGEQSETVTVSVNAVRVDTVSTQLGEVVPATTMTSLSLNGRSYTDLLSIQPGVIPTTTIQSNSVIMAGVTGPVAPSGGLNPFRALIPGLGNVAWRPASDLRSSSWRSPVATLLRSHRPRRRRRLVSLYGHCTGNHAALIVNYGTGATPAWRQSARSSLASESPPPASATTNTSKPSSRADSAENQAPR